MENYDAFISYSHAKDRRIAAALQAVLQRFTRSMSALRVFRDDTGLGAAPVLWAPIEQALAQSRFFILLASPEAAESEWVDKEVAYWLEHKGHESLLIGLTFGDLRWDRATGDFVWDGHTPLPAALKAAFAAEPKWVDLRAYRWADLRHYPIWRNRKFVAVAANFGATIVGVPKDDLLALELDREQKERQRRRRGRFAVAAAVVVGWVGWRLWSEWPRQGDRAQPSLMSFNLPSGAAKPQPVPDKPIVLSLTADLRLFIGDKMIDKQSMIAELNAAAVGDKDRTIYLRADRTLSYDHISGLLGSLRSAGFLKVALVMETAEGK